MRWAQPPEAEPFEAEIEGRERQLERDIDAEREGRDAPEHRRDHESAHDVFVVRRGGRIRLHYPVFRSSLLRRGGKYGHRCPYWRGGFGRADAVKSHFRPATS